MPRARSSSSSSDQSKPYDRVKSESDSPKSKSSPKRGRAWTAAEKRQLYEFTERYGTSDKIPWGDAVPDRTASQSKQTWKVTLRPRILAFLDDK